MRLKSGKDGFSDETSVTWKICVLPVMTNTMFQWPFLYCISIAVICWRSVDMLSEVRLKRRLFYFALSESGGHILRQHTAGRVPLYLSISDSISFYPGS